MKDLAEMLSDVSLTQKDLNLRSNTVEFREQYLRANQFILNYYNDNSFFGKDAVSRRLGISHKRLALVIDPVGERKRRMLSIAMTHPIRKSIMIFLVKERSFDEIRSELKLDRSEALYHLGILINVKKIVFLGTNYIIK